MKATPAQTALRRATMDRWLRVHYRRAMVDDARRAAERARAAESRAKFESHPQPSPAIPSQ